MKPGQGCRQGVDRKTLSGRRGFDPQFISGKRQLICLWYDSSILRRGHPPPGLILYNGGEEIQQEGTVGLHMDHHSIYHLHECVDLWHL